MTGLVVNSKINVTSEMYRSSRSMCYNLFKDGYYFFPYIKPKAGITSSAPNKLYDLRSLESLLGYIYHVKITSDKIAQHAPLKADSRSIWKLRSKLLFFKNFVSQNKTVIVCEGKTDNVYLKCALANLPLYKQAFESTLGSGSNKISLYFLKYTKTATEMLKLGTGIEDIKEFVRSYEKNIERYRHRPLEKATIVLIDNDQGANGLFSILKKQFQIDINHTSNQPFYYLHSNLYVIKTPELNQDGQSCIEDLFDPALLMTKLDGKSFVLKKKHEAENEYGKQVFAERVVKANSKAIDFSNFSLLFDRIGLAEEDYAMRRGQI